MAEILSRSAWTDTDFGFPGYDDRLIDPDDVIGLACHYPADGDFEYGAGVSQEKTLERVRAYHRYHTGSRGWADVGYPVLIDQAGRIVVGAGDTHGAAHSATNAVPDANQRLMAICFIVGNHEQPSPAAIKAANEQIASWRKKFPQMRYVIGHQEVPGASTACPGRVMDVLSQLDLERPGPYAVSPVVGRVTGNYGWRTHPVTGARRNFHRGIDLAPPKPGQSGVEFVAMFGGRVRAVMDGYRERNPITGTWNTGSFVLIDGAGGGSEWYGHHAGKAFVKPGQDVAAGEPLGIIGDVGNVTGAHVHMETWGGPLPEAHQDPRLAFQRYGLKPGKAGESRQRVIFGLVGGATKVASSALSSGGVRSGTVAGTGFTLHADGDFGSFTIRALQKRLHDRGYKSHAIDGDFGAFTVRSLQQFLADREYTEHAVDGVFGPYTVRSLQKFLRQRGHKGHAIDGKFGRYTIRSLQEALLDQEVGE